MYKLKPHKLRSTSGNRKKKNTHTSKTIIAQAYQSRCCFWRSSSVPESLETFQPSYASSKGKWVSSFLKTMPSEIGFPMTLTSGAFLNQKRNKQTSHELHRTILLAALFHLVHQVEKTVKNITRWHKTLSASAISKQVSRRCTNFPHELTCQILTYQSLKIGRRAWSTRDYCEKSQKRLPSLNVKASWIFASEISLKTNFKSAAHEHDLFHVHFKKIELEPAIIWKGATCQRITSKKTLELSESIPEPAIRSSDTGQQIHYFESCQLIKTWMYSIRLQAPQTS